MKNAVWDKLASLTEDELRREVLIPILERTPGVGQVTDVHGSNERGLDVIFFTVDEIRRTCYGMQIKRGDISGGGSRDETVQTIVNQLDLAKNFKHPVAIPPTGEYQIERFIVAANGRISNTAREEISRRTTSSSVDFWDLSEIIKRANGVFTEILQNADTEAISYLQYIEARCETLDALDQVPGVDRRKLSEVFVEPALRRKLDPTLADSKEGATGHSHRVQSLHLPNQTRNSVLIGEQNEGKTSIFRMIAIDRARRLLNGDTELDDEAQIPVIVRSQDVLETGSLRDAVAAVLEKGGGRRRAAEIESDASLKPYLVLVDGFSEIPSETRKRALCKLIEDAVGSEDAPRLIIAARPDDFLRPGYFDGFHHYTISDFDQSQIKLLIRKWTKDTVQFSDVAEKMVDRVRDALQLPGSPIPAIIGVMLYEKEQRFITNTAEAVDKYMVIRLGRYAQEMGIRMEVEWQRKQDLLAEVAFRMVDERLEYMSVEDAIGIMDETYSNLGERSRSKVAMEELVTAGVLEEEDGYISFYRTAFRDFFAAKHVANHHDHFDEFFSDHLFERKWGQTLVFAAGLRRHNSDLLKSLNKMVRRERDQLSVSEHEDYLYGAYLLGRLLSNSDAADREPRLDVLTTAVEAAAESAGILAQEAQEQFGNIGQVVALVGTEHTMLVTIGVPWLASQFRELSNNDDLSEEERYLLVSVYAHLACEDWIDVLRDAIRAAKTPRVIAALLILVHLIEGERHFVGEEMERWREVKTSVNRKRKKFGRSVDEMLEVKGPLLEIERQRIRRLRNKN